MYLEIDTQTFSLYDQIYLEGLKDRRIIFTDDVTQDAITLITTQIKRFNLEDKDRPVSDRKPIEIHVNSFGGSAYDGFSVVNAIVTSKTPVHTYCDGYVMSMGLAIFTAGHKRFAYPYTTFMYHEVSSGIMGKNEEIERVAAENKRIQKMYDSLIEKNSNLTMKVLQSKRKGTKDWYFGAEEALEYGIVTDIIQ